MLLCISGSLRAGSTNTMLLHEAARLYGAAPTFADLRLPLYDGDLEEADGLPEGVTRLAEQIDAATAVLISSPEYNKSISGVLKNALDWVSRVDGNPWQDKPVAVMSANAGFTGGARGSYIMRLALVPFGPRMSTGPEVLLPSSPRAFDGDGRLTNEFALENLTKAMEKLRSEIAA